jgi:hypothetical protein
MNDEQILNKAKTQLAEVWQSEGGPQAALDPAFLDLLISIGLNLIKSCLASGTSVQNVKDMGQRKGILARLRVRSFVRQSLNEEFGIGGFARKGGEKIVETLITSAANAKVLELEQFSQVQI